MKVKYDKSQDLTLIITNEEKRGLLEHKIRDIYSNPIKGKCLELEAYVFLAYSEDKAGILSNANNLDGKGKILIPKSSISGDPWIINLSEKGKDYLETGWQNGIRYDGSSKLFIKTEENDMD